MKLRILQTKKKKKKPNPLLYISEHECIISILSERVKRLPAPKPEPFSPFLRNDTIDYENDTNSHHTALNFSLSCGKGPGVWVYV